jgi:transcriptional regulator with XRE-family HTH domain
VKLDAKRVVEARERLGLAQEELATRAEVSPNTVLRVEHGLDIRPITARRIARGLGLEVGDLYPKAEAPPSSTPDKGTEERRLEIEAPPRSIDELLDRVGAKTRYHALPRDRFEALWRDKDVTERARLNSEFLEERALINPLVVHWREMPASKERSQLYKLWFEVFARHWAAIAKNQEAAQAEADAARREGDELRAKRIEVEAEEFGKAA